LLGFRQRQTYQSSKRRKLPREGAVIATLDVGAAKTVCFIARVMPVTDGTVDCDIIGAGHYGGRQRNELQGRVIDNTSADQKITQRMQSATVREKAIRGAVEAAESLAGERISDVHVTVPGNVIQSRHIGVDLDVAGGFVTGDDITDSLNEGARLITPDGSVSLHTLPTSYSLDGENVGTDPRGMRGSVLTTRMLGVHASENTLGNLQGFIENAGLNVASWIAAPLSMARAVLVDDEKELGVLVIDIGANGVSYTVYHDGRPIGSGGIVPGSAYITRDLAQAFSTPIAHAERQKILHGTVLASTGDDHRFVDMVPFAGNETKSRVSRADMTAVIMPRMEEIYECLIAKIIADGCALNHLRRVVITGGGSQLEGVREHAERIFAMKARLGKPLYIEGAPEALSGPAFSACAGALQEVTDSFGQHLDFPETENHGANTSLRAAGGVGAWLKAKF